MLEAGLQASRFLHYAASAVLFGGFMFPLYPQARDAWPVSQQRLFAALTPLSAVLWLLFTAANMAGSFAALDGETLRAVILDTAFGRLWIARLALGSILFGLLLAGYRSGTLLCLLSGAVLVSLAGTGHAQSEEGASRILHMSADAVHLIAASAWLGGLLPLGFLLARDSASPARRAETGMALSRFSGMGYWAVAALVASGLVNSWFLVGAVPKLWSTPYGQLLSLKLCLFAGMAGLAAANRFVIMPRLMRAEPDAGAPLVMRLRRQVLAEQILGVLILALVGVLGTLEPAAAL